MNTNDKCGELAKKINSEDNKAFSKTYEILKDDLINQGAIFFGDFAASLYAKYMTSDGKNWLTISAN
jgi:hypothetical protein